MKGGETTVIAAATATVPAPTEPATEAPTPSPTEAEAPHAPSVPVPEGYRELKSETLEIRLAPGASQVLDPVGLTGESFPSCATFLFAFSFQLREPYRPADASIRFFTTEMGHRELVLGGDIGKGAGGLRVPRDGE